MQVDVRWRWRVTLQLEVKRLSLCTLHACHSQPNTICPQLTPGNRDCAVGGDRGKAVACRPVRLTVRLTTVRQPLRNPMTMLEENGCAVSSHPA